MANVSFSNEVANEYFSFIQDSTKMGSLSENHVEINTPFVDSTGENISFSIYKENNMYRLSDDGFTIWDLSLNGISIERKGNRKTLFDSNIKYSGFSVEENTIYKVVSKSHLGQAIHDMTQLLINLYDLTYLHRNIVSNQFFLDVQEYFQKHEDLYTFFPEFNITGKSRLNHNFNYVFISNNKRKLTKVEKTISKNKLESILTSWLDTMEERNEKYNTREELYVILSDEGFNDLNDDFQLAFSEYGIKVLNFDDKNALETELAG